MGKIGVDLGSVTTVGFDLAKNVFQLHAVDASGRVVAAVALRRKEVLLFFAKLPPCLVGLEACSSAHHWARELIRLGHDARLMLVPIYETFTEGFDTPDLRNAKALLEELA
jgi:transposase